MLTDPLYNTKLYEEICPGCGAVIDRRDLDQIISHFNFNMETGCYECKPDNDEFNNSTHNIRDKILGTVLH